MLKLLHHSYIYEYSVFYSLDDTFAKLTGLIEYDCIMKQLSPRGQIDIKQGNQYSSENPKKYSKNKYQTWKTDTHNKEHENTSIIRTKKQKCFSKRHKMSRLG